MCERTQIANFVLIQAYIPLDAIWKFFFLFPRNDENSTQNNQQTLKLNVRRTRICKNCNIMPIYRQIDNHLNEKKKNEYHFWYEVKNNNMSFNLFWAHQALIHLSSCSLFLDSLPTNVSDDRCLVFFSAQRPIFVILGSTHPSDKLLANTWLGPRFQHAGKNLFQSPLFYRRNGYFILFMNSDRELYTQYGIPRTYGTVSYRFICFFLPCFTTSHIYLFFFFLIFTMNKTVKLLSCYLSDCRYYLILNLIFCIPAPFEMLCL